MSVSEKHSGIVNTHIEAIQATAAQQNTFIFIRPTEYDSTILIRAGYATKSMDVHHKSSNWGPMAGFVPCDPAFSKKCEGKPNPKEHGHADGAARPVHLGLKPFLVSASEKIEMKTGFILAPAAKGGEHHIPWVAKRADTSTVAGKRAQFEAFQQGGGSTPDHKFCTANPAEIGNKSTLFCLIEKAGEWLVYWVNWEGEIGRLIPLYVFGYAQQGKVNPVTGDYDLWMVAPHFKHFATHATTGIVKDSHGASAASGFTTKLLGLLNIACGRSNNPVFNHGAEAQNYGFTQALDANLAMFTPSGGSRMVRMNQMPGIMADLQTAGYLVVWNKRYGETDPRLMGKGDQRGTATLAEIRKTIHELYQELNNIRSTAKPGELAKEAISTHKMPGLMQKEIGLMAQRFQGTRDLGLEQSRIYRFHRQLLEFLGSQRTALRVLTAGDFPGNYRSYSAQVMQLHNELQQALVSVTTGSGQSDEGKLKEWLNSHKLQIDQLQSFWGF